MLCQCTGNFTAQGNGSTAIQCVQGKGNKAWKVKLGPPLECVPPSPPSPSSPPTLPSPGLHFKIQNEHVWGFVAGVGVVLLLLSLGALCMCCRRRRQAIKAPTQPPKKTTQSTAPLLAPEPAPEGKN